MSDPRLALMEAITRRIVVEARYNGAVIRLAPHFLFERHGELFVSALNLSKAWRSDDERRLGQFKLAGLAETRVMEDAFEPLPSFSPEPPRADDTLILSI